GDWSTPSAPSPIVAAIVCKAATRYVRKRVGSFSPSSSDNQATGRGPPASHSLTSVVFPKPAGAEMRVSLPCSPSFSRSSRRGRLTTFGRSGGRYSFVAKIGVGMSHPPHFLSTLTTSQSVFSIPKWSDQQSGTDQCL